MTRRRRFVGVAAIAWLAAGCSLWGSDADPSLKAGRRALAQNAFREALQHFRVAVTQAPSSASANMGRGEAAEAVGEFDEALEAYRAAVRLAPSRMSRYRLATLADRMGKTSLAVESLKAGLPTSWLQRGTDMLWHFRSCVRLGCEDPADHLFRVLVEVGDHDGALAFARSRGWVREGTDFCGQPIRWLSKETQALLAMLVHPERADCLLVVGKDFTEDGLPRLARLVLMHLIENAFDEETRAEAAAFLRYRLPAHDVTKLAESLNIVGYRLQYRFRQPLEAIEVYRKAIAADPSFSWPYHNIGQVYLRLGQYAKAMEWYRRAVAVNPNHWKAQYNLGWVALRMRSYDEALAAFRQATALNPSDAEGHANLGWVLLKLGQQAEAIGELETAVALDPSLRKEREFLDQRMGTGSEPVSPGRRP